jgi:Domain of unknown function (DUF3576)
MSIKRLARAGLRFSIGRAMALGLVLGLTACGTLGHSRPEANNSVDPNGRFHGGVQHSLLGSDDTSTPKADSKKIATTAPPGAGVGVNSYLWRASLDTLSFLPLASADPFGGTIITDWYQSPNALNERFKVTVYILDRRLRADALKVSVFRQQQDKKGNWVDATVDPATSDKLENAILTRARQMRIETAGND